MDLILYGKPDCHLCEGLQEKLEALRLLAPDLVGSIDLRDITTRPDWWAAYEYEIPVLVWQRSDGSLVPLNRPSPRASVAQLEKNLRAAIAAQA